MSKQETPTLLRDLLISHFIMDEIKILCSDLGVQYEDIEGNKISVKAQSLVTYLQHRNQLIDLSQAITKVRPHLEELLKSGGNTIPIVVAAMTKEEAVELKQEEILAVSPSIDGWSIPVHKDMLVLFRACQEELNQLGIGKLDECYGTSREDWKPYCGQSVRETIIEITNSLKLIPLFYSDRVLGEDKPLREQTAFELQLSGCLLIVDAISLFHPKLSWLLSNTNLVTANESVATFLLSPFDLNASPPNRLIEQQARLQLQSIFHRIENQLDLLCEFGIGGQRMLRRWLFTSLPQISAVVQKQKANRNQLKRFSLDDFEPKGIQRIFAGVE